MKKPFYKKWWFILIVAIIVLGAIGNAIGGDDKGNAKKDNPTKQEETVKKEDSKKDDAKKEDTKKEVAATDAEINAKDAETYKKDIIGQLDAFQDEYDKHWANNWKTTFEGVSKGTVDKYKAYEALNSLDKYYAGLGKKISKTDLPKLSKENQKLLDDYLSGFKDAISTRGLAASEAAKMFDNGKFKPSEMDEIKSTVSYADQQLLSALAKRVTLEQKLGIVKQ